MIFKDVATFVEGGDDGILLSLITMFTKTHSDEISAEAETVCIHLRGVALCDKSIKETQTEHFPPFSFHLHSNKHGGQDKGCITPVSFQVLVRRHFSLVIIWHSRNCWTFLCWKLRNNQVRISGLVWLRLNDYVVDKTDITSSQGCCRVLSPTPKAPIVILMESCQASVRKSFNLLQENINTVVNDERFKHFIRICIILNSLSLGIEHHDQPEVLTRWRRVIRMTVDQYPSELLRSATWSSASSSLWKWSSSW